VTSAATERAPWTVWLASYPRSGSTWTRAVLAALTGPDLDINALEGGPIASSRAAIDARIGFASTDLLPDEIDALRPRCDAALDADLDRIRVRKIHDGLFTGPGGAPIVSPAATRSAIYLVRDPRDVAVSFGAFGGGAPAWAVGRMADPGAALAGSATAVGGQVRQRLGSWSQHVEGWTSQRLFPVAVFRYEDLHADPVGEFGRLAAHAGLSVGPDEIAAAVAVTRFERLRAQEIRNGFRERPSVGTTFFRRGVVGSWRDELPWRLARRIERDHGAAMARLGYRPDDRTSGRASERRPSLT
jgi:aryl sulfotransferase